MGLAWGVVQHATAMLREEKSISTTSHVSPWVSDDSLGALVPARPVVLPCRWALTTVLIIPFYF